MKKIVRVMIVESTSKNRTSIKEEVKRKVVENGYEVVDENPDLVIAIGGDRAFLTAVSETKFNTDILYVGINSGSLGFFQDLTFDYDFEKFIKSINHEKIHLESMDIMDIKICYKNGEVLEKKAINEVFIAGSEHTVMNFTEFVEDTKLFEANANGVIFSTKMGSTGISGSCGGPIVMVDGIIVSILDKPIRNSITEPFLSNPVCASKFKVNINKITLNLDILIDGNLHRFEKAESIKSIEVKIFEKKISRINFFDIKHAGRVRSKIVS